MIYTEEKFQHLPSRQRASLINNCCGIRSANLIGTVDTQLQENLAVFNSVMHLGSDPALIGFILRPLTVERHTYDNIQQTKFFSINQIPKDLYSEAHQTSAKYKKNESEFETCAIEQEYFDDYTIPFVKKSNIKIACRYESEYNIKENGCVMIIGKIEMIAVDDSGLGPDLWINHEKLNSIGIGGLDTYYSVKCMDRLMYAQPYQDSKSIYGPQKTSS